MASDLYTVLSGLSTALSLEKSTRKAEVKYLSSVLSTAFQPKLAGNEAANSGLVYGGADVTISNGQITVLSAGQVKHDLSIFNKTYNGSGAVSITAGTNLSAGSDGSVNVVSDSIESGKTGVAIAGDVYTAVEGAKGELASVSAVLTGQIKNVADDVSTLSTDLGTVSSNLGTVSSDLGTVSSNLGTVSSDLGTVSSKVSGAWGSDSKVIIATGNGIGKSTYTIGAENSTDFGATNELATEKGAKDYVDETISAYNLSNALTGVVANAGPVVLGETGDHRVSANFLYDDTLKVTSNKLGVNIVLSSVAAGNSAAKYQLVDATTKTALGATIDIPKDQYLETAVYNSTNKTIDLTWKLTDGTPSTTSIDVKEFFDSGMAGTGLTAGTGANSGVVNIVKDSTSESFFFVNADTVGVSGIQTAINTATSGKLNQISATTDNLVKFASNGAAVADSGYSIGGTASEVKGSAATANKVATEEGVQATAKDILGATNVADLGSWASELDGLVTDVQSLADATSFAAV